MTPRNERRRQGILAQNLTYIRLREDFPHLKIVNNTSHRRHVDFEITFPDGFTERMEHKAWNGTYRVTVKHVLREIRPKFHRVKGGSVMFTKPKTLTPDAQRIMSKDRREAIMGYGECRAYVHNLALRHTRPLVMSNRRGHSSSFMPSITISSGRVPSGHIRRYWMAPMPQYKAPGIYGRSDTPQYPKIKEYSSMWDGSRDVRYMGVDMYSGENAEGEYSDFGGPISETGMAAYEPVFDQSGQRLIPTCDTGVRLNQVCDTFCGDEYGGHSGGNYCHTHGCLHVSKGNNWHWFRIRRKWPTGKPIPEGWYGQSGYILRVPDPEYYSTNGRRLNPP